jgi:NTP pyrophosphatase (non-canonical NTP hydrolase)
LGLVSEAGEVADKVKKKIRDGKFDSFELAKELGDCLWYTSLLATYLDYNMSEIASININKLSSRRDRNKIQGSGDNR